MTRLLAFTDPHGEIDAARAVAKLDQLEKPDLIVCSGDLTFFGHRHALFFQTLSSIGKPIYFIPGNHEDAKTAAEIAKEWPFMIDVSWRVVEEVDLLITGVPGNDLAFWPGRSKGEEDAVEIMRNIVQIQNGADRLVFLAHYPPTGCQMVDGSRNPTPDAGGSATVRKITEKIHPSLVVTGHYHSCFNCEDRLDGIRILNPGPTGKILEL